MSKSNSTVQEVAKSVTQQIKARVINPKLRLTLIISITFGLLMDRDGNLQENATLAEELMDAVNEFETTDVYVLGLN